MDVAASSDTSNAVDHASDRTLTHIWSHLRFWLVGGVLLAADLWSKHWVFANLGPNDVLPVFGHVLELRRSVNDGAVFGFFTGQVGLFLIASLFAFAFVFYLFAVSRRSQRGLHVALGLILAGAVGNLYDRAVMKADVVTYQAHNGESTKFIGRISDVSTEKTVWIGYWPEGTPVQNYPRDGVVIRQQGIVRDFIKFVPRFPKWVPRLGGYDVWPWVFNVADAALVCGVATLFVTSWLGHRPEDA